MNLFDIPPIPTVSKKETTRGRKSWKAYLLTSSTYRNDLTRYFYNSILNKTKKNLVLGPVSDVVEASKTKRTKPQNDYHIKSKQIRVLRISLPTPTKNIVNSRLWQWQRPGCTTRRLPWYDDSDVTWVFCEVIFSVDTRWETWVKCFQFQLWAHEQCDGSLKDVYICPTTANKIKR